MDAQQFDRLTQGFGHALSRRRLGAVLAALGLGAGFGAGPGAEAKKKKKKKKKPAGNGGGDGCPTGQTRCGGACVDTRTDTRHCGECDSPCDEPGASCSGGECVGPPECSTTPDCSRFNGFNELECVNNRCVCKTSGHGYCTTPTGGRICNPCCPGGNNQCLRDEVCRVDRDPPACACPSGYQRCDFGVSNRCSQDKLTDNHRCGLECQDCPVVNPGSRCCNGACVRGRNPGQTGEPGQPCGNTCQPCTNGQICCNSGPGTPGQCVNPVGAGACPES